VERAEFTASEDGTMTDIYPAKDQRLALLELVKALGARDNLLRRDECGDWRIEGRSGHVYAVPGSLDRPAAAGFQIYVAGSGRWWGAAKRSLAFADLTNDGDDEGMLFLDRLPTPDEAETLRHYVGIAKKRILSEAERERLASYGHRFEKRSEAGDDITAEKTVSDDTAAPTASLVAEEAS
jgi:hypothetical protein